MNNSPTKDGEEFGRRVAQERRRKGVHEERDILQKDVAAALGVSESTVSRWESGEGTPRDAMLGRLAAYFGVTKAWLRYGSLPREAIVEGKPDETYPDPNATSRGTRDGSA